MEITLTVNKEDVMREVAVTTAYTGAKMDKDENALQRISTVDEDESHLERFWEESRADLSQELIGLVSFEGMTTPGTGIADPTHPVNPDPGNPASPASPANSDNTGSTTVTQRYELRLDVSKSFDTVLLPSMGSSLFSYFVQSITAKWYVYTNKEEAGAYADKAQTLLDDIHRKAMYKKKPSRPVYDD